MSVFSSQGAGVTVEAVRYPPCECGVSYAVHLGGPACQGYRPRTPVEALGTRAFKAPSSWPTWKRIACATLWSVEHRAQGWRERIVSRT